MTSFDVVMATEFDVIVPSVCLLVNRYKCVLKVIPEHYWCSCEKLLKAGMIKP